MKKEENEETDCDQTWKAQKQTKERKKQRERLKEKEREKEREGETKKERKRKTKKRRNNFFPSWHSGITEILAKKTNSK